MAYSIPVEPDKKKAKLAKVDPGDTAGLGKAEGKRRADELAAELGGLQEELYAAGQSSVLVVLQGLDTSGKDGTIRHVLSQVNPQGCQVTAFKRPTDQELAHDFLWRVHNATPPRGMLGVFNRSHYEDVLAARVHRLVPPAVWKARYQQINDFERLLVANGTIICKFYLHISKREQERRLLAREQDVDKAYKLAPEDWREREHFDAYLEAYQDALNKCSTAEAPWWIVPADAKWFRNLAIAGALVEALTPHRPAWQATLEQMSKERLAQLAASRRAAVPPPDGSPDGVA
jgi:PPK2 family polyphosphate:nucleotide phosphotransferase